MEKRPRTFVAWLALFLALALGGCDFIDNIFCDLLEMQLCGDDGNVALPGTQMGAQPRGAKSVNEAQP
jgi:hypothetical protein